jgi:hypothetical protein
MAYRIKFAETPEQKAKEESFMGLGLTSRKNLCIHPDVSTHKEAGRALSMAYFSRCATLLGL